MPTPNYSFVLSAQLVASTVMTVGKVMITSADEPTRYVASTTANRGTRKSEGIALTAWSNASSRGAVQMQQSGTIDAEISGLAAGSASLVRCSATGTIERIATASVDPATDDIIGYAEADGRVHLYFGYPFSEMLELVADLPAEGDEGDVLTVVGGAWASAAPAAVVSLAAGDGVRVTGGPSYTVHGVRGTGSLEQHGAVGDGSTSDQAAIDLAETALGAGTYTTLVLGAKSYLGTWGFSVPGSCSIVGQGYSSVVKMSGAVAAPISIGAVNDIVLRDFLILGDGTATGEAYGVKMGVSGLAISGPQRVTLINVHTNNCWASGFTYFRSPKTNHQGPRFIGCTARSSYRGFHFAEEGEYAQMIGCEVTGCTYGVVVAAGNVIISGSNICNNTTGVSIEPGTNDAHGLVSNCTINHNTTNVNIGAITNGHIFEACELYVGDIVANGNVGIVTFSNCHIDFYHLTNTNGKLRFLSCTFDTAYFISCTESGTGWTEFVDCTGLNGALPSYIEERIQRAFTFAGDSNDTLTWQESVAQTLIVQDGTITASRSITSMWGPEASRTVRIVNDNTYDVTFQWASGTAVTIASGEWALVGADGTNAITLEGPGAATAPGGATGDIQYNNAGSFGGLDPTQAGYVLRATGADAAAFGTIDLASADTVGASILQRDNGGTGVDFSSLTGHANKVVAVNGAETAFELQTVSAGAASDGSTGEVQLADGAGGFNAATNVVGGSENLAFKLSGGTTSSAGAIRFTYNGGVLVSVISALDSDGATNRNGVAYGTGDHWAFGNTGQNSTLQGDLSYINGATGVGVQVNGNAVLDADTTSTSLRKQGGTTALEITSARNEFGLPLSGRNSGPFVLDLLEVGLTGAGPKTLSGSEVESPNLTFTGSPNDGIVVKFPEVSGAIWWVLNATGGSINLNDASAASTNITLTSGQRVCVRYDSTVGLSDPFYAMTAVL